MDKQNASKILSKLDQTAETIQRLASTGKLNPKTASELVFHIDTLADKVQVAAYGSEGLKAYQTKVGKVIQKDSDEKFMDTFDSPSKVLQSDPDETFMHKTDASFNANSIDNYDQDRTVTVSERDEYAVRDLSEWTETTKKQPSWARGPAGKSTKQGSTHTASTVAPKKTWSK